MENRGGRRRSECINTEGHAGAGAGEDEDEHGDELGDGGLEGVRVGQLAGAPDRDPADRHSRKIALILEHLMNSGIVCVCVDGHCGVSWLRQCVYI